MTITQTHRRATTHPTPNDVAPGGAHNSRRARVPSASEAGALVGDQPTNRHKRIDAHPSGAVGFNAGPGPVATSSATTTSLPLLDPALALAADVLDDLEKVRVANENRLRQLTRTAEDVDGELRGFGLDTTHPDVARLAAMVGTLKQVEHDATLNLQRLMRQHPLGPWVKAIRGVGEKQAARLLATIGDPYWRHEIVREDGSVLPAGPRTVSALWAYCGLHVLPTGGPLIRASQNAPAAGRADSDPGRPTVGTQYPHAGVAAKRTRGQKANWSANAKTRAYLIAASCIKQLVKPCTGAEHVDSCQCSPYRVAYDSRRAHTAVSRPDWSDGHSHNDGLRIAAKAFLRDLWREARRCHAAPATTSHQLRSAA